MMEKTSHKYQNTHKKDTQIYPIHTSIYTHVQAHTEFIHKTIHTYGTQW